MWTWPRGLVPSVILFYCQSIFSPFLTAEGAQSQGLDKLITSRMVHQDVGPALENHHRSRKHDDNHHHHDKKSTEPCRCKHSWTSPFESCPGTYTGCARVPCSHKQEAWCMVANQPCASEYNKQGWTYCTPIECDGSRIPYTAEYQQKRLSTSTAFLEPNQPVNSKLIFPCSAGYEKGTIMFVCDRSGKFKALNQCVKLSTTTSIIPVTCDGTILEKEGPEVGHSDKRYHSSTAFLAPSQPLWSTLVMGCSDDPDDGSITFVCEPDGVFRTKDNCTVVGEVQQDDHTTDHNTAALVATVVVTVILFVGLAAAVVFLLMRKDIRKSLTDSLLTKKLISEDEEAIAITPLDRAFIIPIDQLEVGEVIAVGGQGQVRKGFFSGNAVACKELLAVVFDPQETEALMEEASILCSIHHPNIVRFYGMAIDTSSSLGASYFLVTDLKAGDLRTLLNKERTLTSEEVLNIACQICEPLAFLHSINMVHRDLKPENILFDSDMTIFLCDFGISKSFREKNSTKLDMTVNMGTAAYMAPETSSISSFARDFSRSTDEICIARDANIDQTEKERLLAQKHATAVNAVDLTCSSISSFTVSVTNDTAAQTDTKLAPKVDCYSYALVLWALLSWEAPFSQLDCMQIIVAVAYHNKRPPTKQLEGKWPTTVLKLMKKMWATNPSQRPSMVEARDTLRSVVTESTTKV